MSNAVQALTDKRAIPEEQQALRKELLIDAINFSKDKLRRESSLVNYMTAVCLTLQSLGHPLAFHVMSDLAYSLNGKDAFSKACAIAGVECPPAIEAATRKPRAAKPELAADNSNLTTAPKKGKTAAA